MKKLDFTKKIELNCDMDGVLTNFEGSFLKVSDGQTCNVYEYEQGSEEFWKLIDAEGLKWWSEMPWMPDGKLLWYYIENMKPYILSAPAKRLPQSREGKKIWAGRELGNDVTLRLTKAKLKQTFAHPNAILIDDMQRNINQWRNAGGIGILHTSAEDTIRQLKALGL